MIPRVVHRRFTATDPNSVRNHDSGQMAHPTNPPRPTASDRGPRRQASNGPKRLRENQLRLKPSLQFLMGNLANVDLRRPTGLVGKYSIKWYTILE